METGHYEYVCSCYEGYHGENCQSQSSFSDEIIYYNNCISNPCFPGSTCIPEFRGFECACPQNFGGLLCEIEEPACASNPCQNNGICIENTEGFTCTCDEYHFGDRCQLTVNVCLDERFNTCSGNSTCEVSNSDPKVHFCICDSGFTGDTCDFEIPVCASSPCGFSGYCIELTGNAYKCNCLPGYTGERCDVETDACQSSPCFFGDCVKLTNFNYRCECQQSYTGTLCKTLIPPCSSNPCQNNGICLNTIIEESWSFAAECPYHYNDILALKECKFLSDMLPKDRTALSSLDTFKAITFNPIARNDSQSKIADSFESSYNEHGYNITLELGILHTYINRLEWTCLENCSEVEHIKIGYANGTQFESLDRTTLQTYCIISGNFSCDFTDLRIREIKSVEFIISAPPLERDVIINIPVLETTVYRKNSLVHTDAFECECPNGWKGTTCSEQVNFCESSPCHELSTCQLNLGGYSCLCPNNRIGNTCSVLVESCLSNPCENFATCRSTDVSLYSTYLCDCLAGYTGIHCETKVDNCLSNPCLQNAECVSFETGFVCLCPETYTGDFCQIENDLCILEKPCRNGGFCVSTLVVLQKKIS